MTNCSVMPDNFLATSSDFVGFTSCFHTLVSVQFKLKKNRVCYLVSSFIFVERQACCFPLLSKMLFPKMLNYSF